MRADKLLILSIISFALTPIIYFTEYYFGEEMRNEIFWINHGYDAILPNDCTGVTYLIKFFTTCFVMGISIAGFVKSLTIIKRIPKVRFAELPKGLGSQMTIIVTFALILISMDVTFLYEFIKTYWELSQLQ